LPSAALPSFVTIWLYSILFSHEHRNTKSGLTLTPHAFRDLLLGHSSRLDEDEIGARTRELSYQVLHAALNRLVKDGTLMRNPLTSVDKPKVPKADIRIPTLAEAQKLLRAAEGTRDYPLILLATLTGMRQGEIFGLQWCDVHLDQGWIWVCHSLTKDTAGKLKLDKPKNEASVRRVDLDVRQVAALAKHVLLIPIRALSSRPWKVDRSGQIPFARVYGGRYSNGRSCRT